MKRIRDKDFLDFMGTREGQYLEPASTWLEDLLNEEKEFAEGDLLPWDKTHDLIQFRRGEVTVWGGINGHGKSLVVNQAILSWLPFERITVASLEMQPRRTLKRMILQTGLSDNPSDSFKRDFMAWTDDRLWIYDQLDQVPFERIIGMVHYAGQELKCKHIVIDSLMKCGIDDNDYNGQKNFVDALCWAAKNENVHIHLVAHMKKNGSEFDRPNKFDVFGSSAITNLVDNLIIFHRNKKKELAFENDEDVWEWDPDATLEVRKNRHGGNEGGIKLFFSKSFQQFNETPNGRKMRMEIPSTQKVGNI